MPKVFTSKTQKIGEVGENIAVKFLVKHGYSVIERNYTKKWGEIDVIAEKKGKLYFIEVKSVSRETLSDVNHETNDTHRPEENMHPWKMQRLSRTIETYLASNRIPEDKEWQVDLLIVYLDLKNKKAKINLISDIVL